MLRADKISKSARFSRGDIIVFKGINDALKILGYSSMKNTEFSMIEQQSIYLNAYNTGLNPEEIELFNSGAEFEVIHEASVELGYSRKIRIREVKTGNDLEFSYREIMFTLRDNFLNKKLSRKIQNTITGKFIKNNPSIKYLNKTI
jgi:hypothetical protein